MLRRAYLPAFALLLLASCGGSLQGPPVFEQTYGVVDEPCAASKVVSHCTAHVLLVNRGGEGLGQATIVVPLKDTAGTASSARTVSAIKCHRAIPDTPAGGYSDLTCDFDVPVGKTVGAVPSLQSVDLTAAGGSSSSGGNISGIATLGLAAVAALLALSTFAAAVAGRRRRTTGSPTSPAPASPQPGRDEDGTW